MTTVLDCSASRIVLIDFIDNPYHGDHYDEEGELCSMASKDGTTRAIHTIQRTSFPTEKPVTLAMTYVRNDERLTRTSACSHALKTHI
jgi:hypothetical protein